MADDRIIAIQAGGALTALRGVESALKNPRPYLEMIADELFRVTKNSFQAQTSPEGKPWASLSPKYAAWKSRHGKGAQGILRFRGQLLRQIFSGVTGNTAFISTGNLAHAAIHQFGFNGVESVSAHKRASYKRAPIGGKRRTRTVREHGVGNFTRHMRMPARPYLGFPKASEAAMIEVIEQDIAAKGNK
jgi:phage virion morphogenesis protein